MDHKREHRIPLARVMGVGRQQHYIFLTFTDGSVSLCCFCSHVVVFGMSVRLLWYPMSRRWLL